MDRIGTSASFVLSSVEEENAVARSLQHLLRAKPTVVLIASTTAPAGPDDVIGRAMVRAGCHIERFLAPVGAGQSLLAGLQRRCSRRICSRLLPLPQTKRRGLDAAADAGPLSCLGLGSRQPRAWRLARLTSRGCGFGAASTSFGSVNQREIFSDWECSYPSSTRLDWHSCPCWLQTCCCPSRRPRSSRVAMVSRMLAVRSSGGFVEVTSVASVITFVAGQRESASLGCVPGQPA